LKGIITGFFWAPLGAAVAHSFEEFVWPSGFMNWYWQYRRPSVTSITPRFLTIVKRRLLTVCVNAALAGDTPIGIAYWIGVSAIIASNGLCHVWAAVKGRVYSPGIVTGLLLYVPLAVYGCIHFLKSGSVFGWSNITTFLIGGSYSRWSAVYHDRSRSAA
jgi:hypothetical protein